MPSVKKNTRPKAKSDVPESPTKRRRSEIDEDRSAMARVTVGNGKKPCVLIASESQGGACSFSLHKEPYNSSEKPLFEDFILQISNGNSFVFIDKRNTALPVEVELITRDHGEFIKRFMTVNNAADEEEDEDMIDVASGKKKKMSVDSKVQSVPRAPTTTTTTTCSPEGRTGEQEQSESRSATSTPARSLVLPGDVPSTSSSAQRTVADLGKRFGLHRRMLTEKHLLRSDLDVPFMAASLRMLEVAQDKVRLEDARREATTVFDPASRAQLREFMTMSVLEKVGDQSGKTAHKALRLALQTRLAELAPPDLHDDTLIVWGPILDAKLKQLPNTTWMVRFSEDPALTFVGEKCAKMYSSRQAGLVTPKRTSEKCILDWLTGRANNSDIGLSLLNWMDTLTDENVKDFRLLKVDDETGYVLEEKSKFFGLRNATSLVEWISLYHYIMVVLISGVSSQCLPSATIASGLCGRCLTTAESMRTGTFRLADVYSKTFLGTAIPVAMVLGSQYIWKAFGQEKMRTPEASQFRLFNLIFMAYHNLICKKLGNDKSLAKLKLSVKDLIEVQKPIAGRTARSAVKLGRPLVDLRTILETSTSESSDDEQDANDSDEI